jgi:hypothetical protein
MRGQQELRSREMSPNWLNTSLRIGINIAEQPGISSSPTNLEGFSLLLALQTSASETGATDRNSEHCERRGKSIEEQLL